MNDWPLSKDLPDQFFADFVAMCDRLLCKPLDLAGVMFSESGMHAYAWNKAGCASGIFQLMPSTALGLGWDPDDCKPPKDAGRAPLARFRLLSAVDQLRWAERFYAPHRGQLTTAARTYLANFLPAFLARPDLDDTTVLCAARGPHANWYAANKVFDHERKGYVVVADLGAQVARACQGGRWEEIAQRLAAGKEAHG